MSMDFRKTTYRPTRTDNRFRTSYALMSQWMNRKGSGQAYRKEPLPQTFAIAMQGNAAFPRQPVFSAGSRSADDFRGQREQYPPDPMLYNVSAPQAAIDENVPVHLRFNDTAGYDDFHKAFNQVSKQWPSASYPDFGPPRLRHGRAGGSWRHVKEVLQAGGSRIVFVDGVIRWADGVKIDEIPGGNLIQPRVGQIKSRYITPSKPEKNPSGLGKSEVLAMNEFHRECPTIWRSKSDMPDFVSWGKSGL
ncbi:uncharacterized protein LOC123525269 isoform X2 [Mercenaria mercenaria]|uniref:uncharacterized protein LOC123525269 isoform X2 n=1 Tax=Mercenaria mercenaria TaxID=6596 RepID=UPI00234EB91D|nr:uncharacterized protein LOC123525269 isoform X2 [Mercenaria mercenaria]